MSKTFYAKKIRGRKQIPVEDHDEAVAKLAREYGEASGVAAVAEQTGLDHDDGKATGDFNDGVLEGKLVRVDHSTAGAIIVKNMRPMDEGTKACVAAISAHHDRLRAYSRIESTLQDIYEGKLSMAPSGKESSVKGRAEVGDVLRYFLERRGKDRMIISGLESPIRYPGESWKDHLSRFVFTKFVFSCQVDADYSVSAYEENGDASVLLDVAGEIDADSAIAALESERAAAAARNVSPAVRAVRDTVWNDCLVAGGRDSKYLTLTAPTGSGKTFGLLRFSLERIRARKARRIIFVLPYLSITDQVAGIVSHLIPGTVVDTSTSELDDEQRLQALKWNAPCVVTTTVQFYESLFSDRPGNSRKLHSLGGSVVIFDEIQALPDHMSLTGMEVLHLLQERYGCTVVLSTATFPAFDQVKGLDFGPEEIIGDVEGCFAAMPVKKHEFRHDPVSVRAIAAEAAGYDNVAVIVNMKRHAKIVFSEWERAGLDGIYLMTTDICPSDRLRIIKEIRRRQEAGLPVHVAATPCIEAGVDLDFRKLFRSLAPLPSIMQADGRRSRNGLYPDDTTTIFEPLAEDGRLYPDEGYKRQAGIVKLMAMEGMDLFSLSGIREYYTRVFQGFVEPEGLTDAIRSEAYDDLSKETKLIKRSGMSVIVPCTAEIDLFRDVQARAVNGYSKWVDINATAQISVPSYDADGVARHCQELVVHRRGQSVHTGVYVLLPGSESCYSPKTGLSFEGNGDDYAV